VGLEGDIVEIQARQSPIITLPAALSPPETPSWSSRQQT
jgi:hypothetical protein